MPSPASSSSSQARLSARPSPWSASRKPNSARAVARQRRIGLAPQRAQRQQQEAGRIANACSHRRAGADGAPRRSRCARAGGVHAARPRVRRAAPARGQRLRPTARPAAAGRPRGSRSPSRRRRTTRATPLQLGQPALRGDRGVVEHRMRVGEAPQHRARPRLVQRIERHDHRLLPGQRLQLVEQVVQADAGRCRRRDVALVVPGRPGRAAARQQARVGVQHGRVGLVADRAQRPGARRRWRRASSAAPGRVAASTTSSNRSTPCARAHDTRAGRRRAHARSTGVLSRGVGEAPSTHAAARTGASRRRTVNHCGRSRTCSRPWLWQKRISVPTGKRSICTVEHDQMQPIIGSRYQSRNARPKRCASRKSPSGCASSASTSRCASAVASRLKRTMSTSMRQKRGRSRLRRCANTVVRLVPLHSRPVAARLHRERHLRRRGLDAQLGEQRIRRG